MPSTYSASLRLELIGDGEQAGSWGQTTNRNLGTLLEQSIAGVANVVHNNATNYTLTNLSGQSDEARCMVLNVTGTLTANRDLTAPSVPKVYIVRNNTAGGFSLTLKTSGGSGIVVASGATRWVWCDGTEMRVANTDGSALTSLNASNLSTGTVPDARFPATLPAVSGANLTNLNATNLASGTVPDARFPATLPAVSGANLTSLNASNLGSGTVPDARFPATLPAVSGANLTNLNATNLASGTVPDARFPATLPAISGANLTALNATQLTTGTIPVARINGSTSANFVRGDGSYSATLANTLTVQALALTNTNGQIIPGPTSLVIRNNANTATNMTVFDTGAVTVAGGFTVNAGGITVTGNSTFNSQVTATQFNVSSSYALKQEISPVEPGALERILSVKVCEYAYKADPDRRTIGAIAEEIYSKVSDGKTINANALLFDLIAAFQEYVRRR